MAATTGKATAHPCFPTFSVANFEI